MSSRTIILMQSVSRTANETSVALNVRSADNLSLDIAVTSITGTSVTFTVQALDAATQTWFTLLASAAQVAAGRVRLNIGPGMPTTANLSVTTVVPPTIRVATSGTWNPAVFSVVATLQS